MLTGYDNIINTYFCNICVRVAESEKVCVCVCIVKLIVFLLSVTIFSNWGFCLPSYNVSRISQKMSNICMGNLTETIKKHDLTLTRAK